MVKLEAFVLHKSDYDQDYNWYSLGVFEMRSDDVKAGLSYQNAAKNFREKAEREYKRPVKLIELS